MTGVSPADLRAGGLLFGRMAASMIEMADAIERKDHEAQRKIAHDVMKIMGAWMGGLAARDLAEAIGCSEIFGKPSAQPVALSPEEIDRLLKQ